MTYKRKTKTSAEEKNITNGIMFCFRLSESCAKYRECLRLCQ